MQGGGELFSTLTMTESLTRLVKRLHRLLQVDIHESMDEQRDVEETPCSAPASRTQESVLDSY